MNIREIELCAGQMARIVCNVTAPEGTDITLRGAVDYTDGAGAAQRAEAQAEGSCLTFGALPAGRWVYEIRCGGRTLLYGHMRVHPSPLEPVPGISAWQIDAALDAETWSIHLQETAGPRGESAYDAWLAAGNDGSEADFLASLRPSADELAQAAEAAACEIVQADLATPAGTANATCQYIELDAQHVPQGTLQAVALRCRSGNNPATRSYLAVWELGEDGETWSHLGSSANNPAQAMNTTAVWEFEEGAVSLAGRTLRLLPQAERSDAWEIGPQLGVRTTPTPDGDATRCFNNGTGYAFLPELSITAQAVVPKYAPAAHAGDSVLHVTAAEREAWNAKADAAGLDAHAQNAEAHVTAAEHAWLDAACGGEQEIAAPVLRLRGTLGNVLLTLRGNQSNVSVTGNAVSFNVGQYHVMSDTPVIYSYDAASGAYHVFFAVAPNDVALAPMGIAEAGAHVGAPHLPLRLRGSAFSVNGTELDAAGLAELLARKDELLALLNAG